MPKLRINNNAKGKLAINGFQYFQFLGDTSYGYLYNGYAAKADNFLNQNDGWHIPSDSEWDTLISYAGGSSVAGGKLKETGYTHWQAPNSGADNSFGYTALAGGIRSTTGAFSDQTSWGYWWTTTAISTTNALYLSIYYNNITVTSNYSDMGNGYSIKGVRNVILPGRLYNGYSVNTGKLAPTGWHVPSKTEFETLGATVGGSSIGGAALKEIGEIYWTNDTGTSNSSYFCGIGTGSRLNDVGASFNFINAYTNYWTSTSYGGAWQYVATLRNDENTFVVSATFDPHFPNLVSGNPVRCIKDDSTDPGTVTDYDGNVYRTIKLGSQVWMQSDLRVAHYNDGAAIPNVTGTSAWLADTSGGWCWYNNSEPTETLPTTVADYDGNVYDVVHINTQLWTIQNLKSKHYYNGRNIPYAFEISQWGTTQPARCTYNNTGIGKLFYNMMTDATTASTTNNVAFYLNIDNPNSYWDQDGVVCPGWSGTIELTSNTSWTVTYTDYGDGTSWADVDFSGGTGNKTLTITVHAYIKGVSPRAIGINFVAAGVPTVSHLLEQGGTADICAI